MLGPFQILDLEQIDLVSVNRYLAT